MKIKKTARGFSYSEFTDHYGVPCSIKKSSLATEDAIWLGCDEIGLKRFVPGKGCQDVQLEQDPEGVRHTANTQMHLTRKMVRDLLPVLTKFAETGELE